jgi:hypothetical protein
MAFSQCACAQFALSALKYENDETEYACRWHPRCAIVGTSARPSTKEITPFRIIAEDRNAIRAAAPSFVGEMGYRKRGPRRVVSRANGQSPVRVKGVGLKSRLATSGLHR